MQKFIVPQFIDVESKILGPITVRQFATVAVGGIFLFVAYRLADFSLFLVWTVVILILTGLIAFYKFNGLPFHIFMINMISTYKRPMLRVWLKEEFRPTKESKNKKNEKKEEKYFVPKKEFSSAKLSEIALIIDTGGIYKGEAESNKLNKTLYQTKS